MKKKKKNFFEIWLLINEHHNLEMQRISGIKCVYGLNFKNAVLYLIMDKISIEKKIVKMFLKFGRN